MRHYLWHDNIGEIKGRSDGVGGFTGDPMDSGTTDPQALSLRNYFMTTIGLLGPIPYDCPCDPDDISCICSGPAFNDHYIDNGSLILKPSIVIKIDGNAVSSGAMIEKAPGSFVNFRLEADAPDGHQVALRFEEAVLTTAQNPTLTFANGATESILLRAPAQGLIGRVGTVVDKQIGPVYVTICGWA
jgi:hypothetical protein